LEINPLWFFLLLILFVFLGHPLAYVLGAIGLFFGLFFWERDFSSIVYWRFWEMAQSYIWVCVPLFIFMGYMLERSGVADRLYRAVHVSLGGIRGGLAVATIIISAVLATTIGVIGASVTTVGVVSLNPMLRRGYDKRLVAGTILAGGGLGIIIPPSILLILYASWAGVSLGRMFMAAFIPGLVLAALYSIYILIRCRLNPELGPSVPAEERAVSVGKKILLLSSSLLPVLILIFAVLGTIFFGIATPTESAAFGALGSMLIAAANRKLTWSAFFQSCYNTARASGVIFLIAAAALIFNTAFVVVGATDVLHTTILGLGLGPWGLLVLMMVVIFILGCFMDWIPILLIVIPIIVAVATKAGFDPIWLGTIICINLQIGYMTPPFAPSLFYLKAIAPPEMAMSDILWSTPPFIALMALGLAIVMLFPQLALWLPNLVFGHY
jgi:tripartite ATP-independent transporter DctM subunit